MVSVFVSSNPKNGRKPTHIATKALTLSTESKREKVYATTTALKGENM
jgi:hypothetical protein